MLNITNSKLFKYLNLQSTKYNALAKINMYTCKLPVIHVLKF